jgi:hypothetical protein
MRVGKILQYMHIKHTLYWVKVTNEKKYLHKNYKRKIKGREMIKVRD